MGTLDGKVAIVTGSARNIGRAIALALARDGAAVMVHAKSDMEGVDETRALIEAAGGRALGLLADLSREAGAEALIEAAADGLGRPAILVNNAALRRNAPFAEIALAEWREVLRVNLDSAFLATRAALPRMIAEGWGRIVNLGGISAHLGVAGRAHVATAKAGLTGLTRALAVELGPHGITVNCVVPGAIETTRGASAGAPPPGLDAQANPLGRRGTPDEIAHVVAMLCQPSAAYTTGQTIHVSGGAYLP